MSYMTPLGLPGVNQLSTKKNPDVTCGYAVCYNFFFLDSLVIVIVLVDTTQFFYSSNDLEMKILNLLGVGILHVKSSVNLSYGIEKLGNHCLLLLPVNEINTCIIVSLCD